MVERAGAALRVARWSPRCCRRAARRRRRWRRRFAPHCPAIVEPDPVRAWQRVAARAPAPTTRSSPPDRCSWSARSTRPGCRRRGGPRRRRRERCIREPAARAARRRPAGVRARRCGVAASAAPADGAARAGDRAPTPPRGGDHHRRRVAQLRQEDGYPLGRAATWSSGAATSMLRADAGASSTAGPTRREALGDAVLTSPEAEIRASSMYLDLDERDRRAARRPHLLRPARLLAVRQADREAASGRATASRTASSRPATARRARRTGASPATRSTWRWTATATSRAARSRSSTVPVLWLPRAAFPVYRERQSGLLFPRVGFSNRRGFQLLQPYYWAINKNQDATREPRRRDLAARRPARRVPLRVQRGARTAQFQVGYFNEVVPRADRATSACRPASTPTRRRTAGG